MFYLTAVKADWSFRYKSSHSIRTQAVKLHEKFDHFKYSLRVNIWGDVKLFTPELNKLILETTGNS